MGELSWLLTVYELAFLLFRVKEAAQVEDDGQKEHEAGHSDDGHILFPGEGTIEIFTPQSAGHIHLKQGNNNIQLTTATGQYYYEFNPLRFPVLYAIHPRSSAKN